ncbi:MAG: hypothetical protein JWP66_944 [Naasia sp.]|jgi:hypothetical protein|nr:hypothetical protein [Naasia sp.]
MSSDMDYRISVAINGVASSRRSQASLASRCQLRERVQRRAAGGALAALHPCGPRHAA